jgi:hypothetical protein
MSVLAASVRAKGLSATAAVAAVLYTVAVLGPALAAENEPIPNFSPDNVTGWLKPPGDEFLPPTSGPGPVKSDPAHPYVSNAVARQETVKIADAHLEAANESGGAFTTASVARLVAARHSFSGATTGSSRSRLPTWSG